MDVSVPSVAVLDPSDVSTRFLGDLIEGLRDQYSTSCQGYVSWPSLAYRSTGQPKPGE